MQIDELKKPLDKAKVKTRDKGNTTFSYMQSWQLIEEANRIFGFDGWERRTVYCKEVSRIPCSVGKGNYAKDGFKVGYEAKVRIKVFLDNGGEVTREGTGHGSGQMADLYDCIESAAKEAESDAMKRALMTFGNPFGLALYDTTQRNVEDSTGIALKEAKEIGAKITADMRSYKTKAELLAYWNGQADNMAIIMKVNYEWAETLQDRFNANMEQLNG